MNKANFSRTKLYLKNELVFLQPVEYNSYFAGACISWRRDANGGTWQPHYRITDHLGSTRLETSSNGTITAAYDYKPFGEQIPLMTSKTRKTYIGKERDDESYLGDFGVRKYDYAAGRFTSPDVLWEKYINWSPYHYCMNNPISKPDITGFKNVNNQRKNWGDAAYYLTNLSYNFLTVIPTQKVVSILSVGSSLIENGAKLLGKTKNTSKALSNSQSLVLKPQYLGKYDIPKYIY